MSLDPCYFEHLDHFGSTETLDAAFRNHNQENVIALRHDVDHDLDFALEMSYWEHQQGIRSTYFLLHTADYWNDPRLFEKALQIQDFGHEIGLHVNILTSWFRGQTDNASDSLRSLLESLREAGLRITGMSAHGDRCCYEHQFINYWIFKELRPDNPADVEFEKSPEGIMVESKHQQITYPESGRLVRDDGNHFDLWSVSMAELGLQYDAIHIPHQHYFSDTGGAWTRTLDPLSMPLDKGRFQVLMHPIYYRGRQRIYFFLSTARSGSKWLSNFLNEATPLTARHELTLNHRSDGQDLVAEHRTGSGFVDLQNAPHEARQLMIEQRLWLDNLPGDYAEANVYLESFRKEVEEIYPDAVTVHLVRHPSAVVQSILNRDWYDTPGDDRHPQMDIKDWQQLSQFEKCCWYVRRTCDSLSTWCRHRLMMEPMVADLSYLKNRLLELGIPVYPRLAPVEHGKIINANQRHGIPVYDDWTPEMKRTFSEICGPVLTTLGYKTGDSTDGSPVDASSSLSADSRKFESVTAIPYFDEQSKPVVVYETDFDHNRPPRYHCDKCDFLQTGGALTVTPQEPGQGHLLFSGNGWHKQSFWGRKSWRTRPATYYRVSIRGQTSSGGMAALYCLMHDQRGDLLMKRNLGSLNDQLLTHEYSFQVRRDATHFTIAIYFSKGITTKWARLAWFRLEALPMIPAV